jgi:hypothetical protein
MNYAGVGAGAGANGEDAMRLAFEQFMLQGKSNTKNKNQQQIKSPNTKQLEQIKREEKLIKEQQETNQIQQELRKAERKYWSIFHKFCNILQTKWMDIDDQTLDVVQSVSGIRQRLPMEMKLSRKFNDATMKLKNNDWKCQGNSQVLISSQSKKILLQKEDAELALSHDLLQHEKMMEGLRTLFSNLSEMHEALSRTLDEMTKHHLDQQEQADYYHKYYSALSFTSYFTSTSLVEVMNDLYHMLSLELYRKQCMTKSILNSADDRILLSSQEEKYEGQDGGDWDGYGPKKIVKLCLRDWPRSCDQSCIDIALLDHVISLHEETNSTSTS